MPSIVAQIRERLRCRPFDMALYGNKIRIIGSAATISLFGMVAAFGTVQDTLPLKIETRIDPLLLNPASLTEPGTALYWYEDRYSRGDTFASMLSRLRVESDDVARMLRDKVATDVLRQLRPGTLVQAEVSDNGLLESVRFVSDKDQLLGFDRSGDEFVPIDPTLQLERQVMVRAAYVDQSLFAAADAAGIPDSIATRLSEVFGAAIDFNRGLKPGDRFTVVYEQYTHNGRVIRPGRLLAAEVVHEKQVHRAVWFEAGDVHGYYTPEGKSLRQAFLPSPLEVSRITSGFEMRFDPFARQWKAHKGIDFAAPVGTNVRATSDGVIDFVGQQSGYGNVVIVKHQGDYSTLYAHLHNFAYGLSKGVRVAQGDSVGTVGQTGWATGPHLHYEFRVHDNYVDPLDAALPTAAPLGPREQLAFKAQISPLTAQLDLLRNTTVATVE